MSKLIAATPDHLQITLSWRALGIAIVLLLCVLGLGAHMFQPDSKKEKDFPVDASQATTIYANFCSMRYMPEEVILDLGLNTAMEPDPRMPVKITTRVVLNYYTLKRMQQLFQATIEQFEATYGPIEIEVNKRVKQKETRK